MVCVAEMSQPYTIKLRGGEIRVFVYYFSEWSLPKRFFVASFALYVILNESLFDKMSLPVSFSCKRMWQTIILRDELTTDRTGRC